MRELKVHLESFIDSVISTEVFPLKGNFSLSRIPSILYFAISIFLFIFLVCQ